MKTYNEFTRNFTKDRDKAVTGSIETNSLEPYKAFYEKYVKLGIYCIELPKDETLWISIMKMACNSRGISKTIQAKAWNWLEERGYKKCF